MHNKCVRARANNKSDRERRIYTVDHVKHFITWFQTTIAMMMIKEKEEEEDGEEEEKEEGIILISKCFFILSPLIFRLASSLKALVAQYLIVNVIT